MVGNKFFFAAYHRMLKMPSWEINISEQDIVQHAQIATEKYFFLYYKLGWHME